MLRRPIRSSFTEPTRTTFSLQTLSSPKHSAHTAQTLQYQIKSASQGNNPVKTHSRHTYSHTPTDRHTHIHTHTRPHTACEARPIFCSLAEIQNKHTEWRRDMHINKKISHIQFNTLWKASKCACAYFLSSGKNISFKMEDCLFSLTLPHRDVLSRGK